MNAPLPAASLTDAAPWPMGAASATFDADGFLADGDRWTAELARELAAADGIESLTELHWTVIHLVRRRYHELGALPVMRLVCRAAGLDPRHAHHLFGSCRSLWRIAGLPHPGDEALAYMH